MNSFYDHPTKKVIRENWCKPLIKHISENLGYKLAYLGLPGIEAIDIISWIKYIDRVIAFDIGDYSDDYNTSQAKSNIMLLNDKLSDLERKELIETYSLYHGYIEEVVLKGMDRNRVSFLQREIVTIYNLDFCNSLTVPLKIIDPNTGECNTFYKTEVIRKLLELQRDISKQNGQSKFVLFLTIHSQFWQDEANTLFSGSNNGFYKTYLSSLKHLGEHERNMRLLRLYIIDLLKTQFCSCQFIPEFFPTLYYQGTGANKLLCFTILGTYYKSASSTAPIYQVVEELILSKFLNPTESGINYLIQENTQEKNCLKDSVENLQSFKSYLNIWKKK